MTASEAVEVSQDLNTLPLHANLIIFKAYDTHPPQISVKWPVDFTSPNFASLLADFCITINRDRCQEPVRVEIYAATPDLFSALDTTLGQVLPRFKDQRTASPIRMAHYFGAHISVVAYPPTPESHSPAISVRGLTDISDKVAVLAAATTPTPLETVESIVRAGCLAEYDRLLRDGTLQELFLPAS